MLNFGASKPRVGGGPGPPPGSAPETSKSLWSELWTCWAQNQPNPSILHHLSQLFGEAHAPHLAAKYLPLEIFTKRSRPAVPNTYTLSLKKSRLDMQLKILPCNRFTCFTKVQFQISVVLCISEADKIGQIWLPDSWPLSLVSQLKFLKATAIQ